MKYILITLLLILFSTNTVLAQDSYVQTEAYSTSGSAQSYASAWVSSSSSSTSSSSSSSSSSSASASVSTPIIVQTNPTVTHTVYSYTTPTKTNTINTQTKPVTKTNNPPKQESTVRVIALNDVVDQPKNNQPTEKEGKTAELIPLTENQTKVISDQKKEISEVNKLNNTLTYTIFALILLVILGLVALALFLHKNRVRKVIKY